MPASVDRAHVWWLRTGGEPLQVGFVRAPLTPNTNADESKSDE